MTSCMESATNTVVMEILCCPLVSFSPRWTPFLLYYTKHNHLHPIRKDCCSCQFIVHTSKRVEIICAQPNLPRFKVNFWRRLLLRSEMEDTPSKSCFYVILCSNDPIERFFCDLLKYKQSVVDNLELIFPTRARQFCTDLMIKDPE